MQIPSHHPLEWGEGRSASCTCTTTQHWLHTRLRRGHLGRRGRPCCWSGPQEAVYSGGGNFFNFNWSYTNGLFEISNKPTEQISLKWFSEFLGLNAKKLEKWKWFHVRQGACVQPRPLLLPLTLFIQHWATQVNHDFTTVSLHDREGRDQRSALTCNVNTSARCGG